MANLTGRQVVWKTPTFTMDGLKEFTAVMTVIANFGIAIVQNGIIHLDRYTQESLSQALADDSRLMFISGVGVIMQLMAGMAVTLSAFLLVEGFKNTSDVKKYLLRMAFFALISEIPYDLAIHGEILEFSGQNVFVSLLISLLMVYFLDMLKEGKGVVPTLMRCMVVLGGLVWVSVFRGAYGLCIVPLSAVFYLCYTRNVLKTVLGVIISLLYVTGPITFYGIWCCNYVRKDRFPKLAYYVLYPAHLLLFGLIVKIFLQ